jgi:hypothetical protein
MNPFITAVPNLGAFGAIPGSVDVAEDKLDEALLQVREMNKELSSQALTLLPIQITLITIFAGLITKATVNVVAAVATTFVLAVVLALIGLALARVNCRPLWVETTTAKKQELLRAEADRLREKGIAVGYSAFLSLPAAGLVVISALTTL